MQNHISLPRISQLSEYKQTVGGVLTSFQQRFNEMQPEDHVMPINRFGFVFGDDSLVGLAKDLSNASMDLAIREHAIKQLCSRAKVPVDFFKKMPFAMKTMVLNHFVKEYAAGVSNTERMMMFRTVNDPAFSSIKPGMRTVRSLMTESYTPFDDVTVFQHAAEILGDAPCIVQFSKVEELNTHVRIIFPNDLTEIKKGTVVARMIHLRNSEVGNGSVGIEGGLLVVNCTNGMLGNESTGKYSIRHVGNAGRVRDYVRQALDDTQGITKALIGQFQESLEIKVNDPKLAFAAIMHAEGLSRDSFDAMLTAYQEEPMESLFGITQAITRAAQAEKTTEARYQVERVATRLLDAPKVALNPLNFIPKKEYAALGIEV